MRRLWILVFATTGFLSARAAPHICWFDHPSKTPLGIALHFSPTANASLREMSAVEQILERLGCGDIREESNDTFSSAGCCSSRLAWSHLRFMSSHLLPSTIGSFWGRLFD